jgi:hypothetical protein
MVERFFRDLTQNRLRRGVFHEVEELIMAIGEYIDKNNQNPKLVIRTAKASESSKRSNAPGVPSIIGILPDAHH